MQIRAFLSTLALTLALLPTQASALAGEEEAAAEPATPLPAAEQWTPREQIPPAAGAPMLHGKLALSLADAIAMGLENNLDVEIQRHAPLIAKLDAEAAWGAYDPESFAEIEYSSIEDPNAFSLNAAPITTQDTTGGFGGFRGQVPLLGSRYNLQLEGSRATTNSSIQSLSPELRSSFSLSLAQPLLRGLIWDQAWTLVKSARLVQAASQEQFRQDVMDAVTAIEDAYWQLNATEEQRRVAEKSLDTARALLEQTRTQHEVGVVSKVEVFQAEAGVAEREYELIVAKNRYRNAQDELIDAVLGPYLRAQSTLEIEPTDRPEDYVAYDIDVELAVQRAFQNRPELVVAQREIDRKLIELKFAKNRRLPQLDVQLSYGNRGLAGSENPDLTCRFGATRSECEAEALAEYCTNGLPAPCDRWGPGVVACQPGDGPPCPTLPPTSPRPSTSYGDTFNNFFTGDAAQQFIAGGIFSIPIPNTAARRGVSRAELELRRAKTSKRRLEQSLISEIRRTARNLASAQEGIEAAERRRLAAEEQLRAERIRLEYGESTPFDVLQKERDLVDAESQKIAALQIYRTSATGLDRAQGTILQNRNIAIEDVSRLR